MLKLTKTGIGLLTRQYRSVLKKCWAINVGIFAATVLLFTITPKIVYAERDGNNTERWSYGNYYIEIRPLNATIDLAANNYLTSIDENSIIFFYNSVMRANYSWDGLSLYDSSSALKSTLQNAQLTINAAAKGSRDDPDGVRVMSADGSQGRVYLYNNSNDNGHVLVFDSNGKYGGELYSSASEGGIVNLYLSGVEKTRLSATGFKLNGSDTMTGITHNGVVTADASSTVAKLVSESTLARSLNNYYTKNQVDSDYLHKYLKVNSTGTAASATGTDSIALGVYNTASGLESSAVGAVNTASGQYSSAFGAYSNAAKNFTTAIGYRAVANVDVTTDTNGNPTQGIISVGHKKNDPKGEAAGGGTYTSDYFSRIINVAAGSAANDAVIVSQLGFTVGTATNHGNKVYSTVADYVSNNYYRKEDLGGGQVIDFARYFKSGKFWENAQFLGVANDNFATNLTSKIGGFATNHPPRLGAFAKCEKACSRLSERFIQAMRENRAFEDIAFADAGTFLRVQEKNKNVMDSFSQNAQFMTVANDNFAIVTTSKVA